MKLPDFKSESEEIKFWEKHSIADYWEDLKESDEISSRIKFVKIHVNSWLLSNILIVASIVYYIKDTI